MPALHAQSAEIAAVAGRYGKLPFNLLLFLVVMCNNQAGLGLMYRERLAADDSVQGRHRAERCGPR
jgi:hypothetical protein